MRGEHPHSAEDDAAQAAVIKVPTATVSASMPTPKVGVRPYFATEHLWDARHMAQLCAEREATLVDQGFRGIDRAVRSFALAAIMESVAFLEALINGVWQDRADYDPESPNPGPRLAGLSVNAIARLRELWRNDRVERSLSVLDKYQVALTCVDQPILDLGGEPGQSVDAIILLRNDFVHFKPKVQWIDELHRLEKRLRPRLGQNPLFVDGNPWFQHHVLTSRCAKLAYEKSREFAENWWQRMGFTWDAVKEVDEIDPQMPVR
jgi:hypothetical protein